MLGLAPSKTHELRCLQIIHAPRIINMFSPFLCPFCIFLTALRHQLAKDVSFQPGAHRCNPNG
uniref:Uncharacterized protein n=1 Tax=Arundo donax TaxID=35708 RepID=A0A0A8ZMU1_ARUDO